MILCCLNHHQRSHELSIISINPKITAKQIQMQLKSTQFKYFQTTMQVFATIVRLKTKTCTLIWNIFFFSQRYFLVEGRFYGKEEILLAASGWLCTSHCEVSGIGKDKFLKQCGLILLTRRFRIKCFVRCESFINFMHGLHRSKITASFFLFEIAS